MYGVKDSIIFKAVLPTYELCETINIGHITIYRFSGVWLK